MRINLDLEPDPDIIPNHIFQIFLGEEENIEDYERFMVNKILWKKYSHKYGFWYRFINKDNVDEYLGQYKDFYYSLKYTWNRIDFIRYLVINQEGGIYIDLDIEPNFDNDLFHILDRQIILNKWWNPNRKRYELNNAVMGIRKGGFKELLEYSRKEYVKKLEMPIYNLWKIRFMMHSTGTRMFKRWCKTKGYDFTPEIHEYLTDHMQTSWLQNFH